MDYSRVLNRVLLEITPSGAEHGRAEAAVSAIMAAAKKAVGKDADFILAGSYTRNTYMKDKKEFDIFIRFPEKWSRKRLEKNGLAMGKRIVKSLRGTYQIAYAEHPYTRAKALGYDIDIVPCYRVKSPARIKSAVDRTPFHVEWLNRNLRPEHTSHVRLLKQLAKGQGLYGSDTRVLGLSGYLCELLVIHYGTFLDFARAASRWSPGEVVLDPALHHRKGVPENLKARFRGQPLIVIDPVDPNRNVAAALSPANFERLVDVCRKFLKNPRKDLFLPGPRKVTLGSLERMMLRRKTRMLGILFDEPQVIQDVLWPQMRRFAKRMSDILEEYEFHVIGTDVWSDPEFSKKGKCLILLELEVWNLPDIQRVDGPSIFSHRNADNFLLKYRDIGKILVKDGHWSALIPRKFRKAEDKIRDSLNEREKILLAKGIPSHIARVLSKSGFRLLDRKNLMKLAKRKPETAFFLEDYMKREVLV